MPLEWPDISKNQLMQVGLGLLGSGFGRGQTNPFQAAAQGLAYGKQSDKLDAEEARQQEAAENERRLRQAWAGMFGVGDAPQPDTALQAPVGPADGLRLPQPGMGPQMASAAPGASGMAGMAPQQPAAGPGAPQGNPMLAGLSPQEMSFYQALGPERGGPLLMERMNRQPKERRIVQGADGYNYYADTQERVIPGAVKPGEKPTEVQRNMEAAGYKPGTPDYQKALQRYLFKQDGSGGPGGPFAGTGMDAQTMNILLNGDPSSSTYRAAYNYAAAPKVTYNQQGQMVSITPDMSAYRSPAGGGVAQAQAPQAGSAPPNRAGVSVEQIGQPILTDAEKIAAGFSKRMETANQTITDLEGIGSEYLGNLTGSDYFPNTFKSGDRQRLEQAQRSFVNAVLRKESGAVISDEEFDNAAKQYFPQPGDGPDVIAQKRIERQQAIENMKLNAARANKEGPSSPPPAPKQKADLRYNPETGELEPVE